MSLTTPHYHIPVVPTMPRAAWLTLLVLELFNGLSAVAGGLALGSHPDGTMLNMPTTYLAGSPFVDYAVPGLLLGVVEGCGMLVAAALLAWHSAGALELAAVVGVGLVIFVGVEYAVIGFNVLQLVYGVLGAAVAALALWYWVAAQRPARAVLR
jgi:hypothetical protein